MSQKHEFGKHYLVEFEGCDPERIKYLEPAKEVFLRAVRDCKATHIGDIFHQFEPYGVSGVVLIAESHMSFHT
jgi:S-adenosylmethionine/arginine decarboxylase-like enzyme